MDIIGNRACFSDVVVNSKNLNVNVASSSDHIATAVFPEKQIAKTLTKGEFTQYPFFVRFRPFFYVFASP